jgi:hypothetical protein
MAVARSEVSTDDLFRATLLAVAIGGGAFIVGAVLFNIVALVLLGAGVPVMDPAVQIAVGTVVLQGVTFFGGGYLYLRLRGDEAPEVPVAVPPTRQLGIAAGGLVLLLALLIGIQAVLMQFGISIAESAIVEEGAERPWLLLVLMPASLLLVGPGEELLFRGLVQGHLREAYSAPAAILLASAVFAVTHLGSFSGPGVVASLAVVFTLALVLGGLYEYTDNLAVPALVHGTFNALQFLLAYLEVTGSLPLG